MSGFTVAVTNGLRTADGQPCFSLAAFHALAVNPDVAGHLEEQV